MFNREKMRMKLFERHESNIDLERRSGLKSRYKDPNERSRSSNKLLKNQNDFVPNDTMETNFVNDQFGTNIPD